MAKGKTLTSTVKAAEGVESKAVAVGADNAVAHQGLKLDIQTPQAANDVAESLWATGQLPNNFVTKKVAGAQ